MTREEIEEAIGNAEVVFQSSYDELLDNVCRLVADARKHGAEHWRLWADEGLGAKDERTDSECRRLLTEMFHAAESAAVPLEEDVLVPLLTECMREADRDFERVGGSTRHHVRDCLIPALERAGLGVVRLAEKAR